jgi:twinkle protein
MVLGLERNGQADDVQERNTTRVRVLKNRFSGTTGPACSLLYSMATGRMVEIDEEDL